MPPDKRNEILKAALKTRIACLTLTKSSMESTFRIGIGSLEDLQRCGTQIKDAEDLLLELDEVKP